jgi:hypothetical protein
MFQYYRATNGQSQYKSFLIHVIVNKIGFFRRILWFKELNTAKREKNRISIESNVGLEMSIHWWKHVSIPFHKIILKSSSCSRSYRCASWPILLLENAVKYWNRLAAKQYFWVNSCLSQFSHLSLSFLLRTITVFPPKTRKIKFGVLPKILRLIKHYNPYLYIISRLISKTALRYYSHFYTPFFSIIEGWQFLIFFMSSVYNKIV